VVMCAVAVGGLLTGPGCLRLRRGRLGHYPIFTDRLGTC
jgi:hypothetical protein